ncbi:MAG: hypothetical protein GY845_28365 [Planctomycetes bacterium]|nr:hypothetical protein [Planctomycetota bacterium]
MTSYIVPPARYHHYIVEWHVVTVKEFLSPARKMSLHRSGFPAILVRCADGDVGDNQQTSIQDVEHD